MKIFGFSSGSHDSSYCIMEDGVIKLHEESERITRIKECEYDPILLFKNNGGAIEEFDIITTFPHGDEKFYPKSMEEIRYLNSSGKSKLVMVGHHQSHAANAFYSSDFEKALIFTIDGGGWDFDEKSNLFASSFSSWIADGINFIPIIRQANFNLGWAWSALTSNIFKMSGGGPPYGCEAGTVMAMAALGDSERYYEILDQSIFNYQCPVIENMNEKDMFDFAASLQKKTEDLVISTIENNLNSNNISNVCLSGGVVLNCVMCGKLFDYFKNIKFYIPPVPYDAGLSIGCCQYVWHNVLHNSRFFSDINSSAYLGKSYGYEDVLASLSKNNLNYVKSCDEYVVKLLDDQNIVSIYGGRSESGRRALGNRSILADPRSNLMKSKINEKVKHRKSFRPFAPSVLREKVSEWFVHDIDSPYMSFAIKFKDKMHLRVPAVNHVDNTARIQTVEEKDNPWFYNFIKKWECKSGVPILLNTSFNDREPIVETCEDAVNCFLKTDIDYLYFRDFKILVSKNK